MENEIEKVEGEEEIIKDDKVEGDKRIRDLSGKVKDIATQRDAEIKARVEAEKDRDFFKGFTATTSKYPAAAEFQDKIREKVMAGYDVEDATVSVLAKEGKLVLPKAEQRSPVGGSAITNAVGDGTKAISEMTREEKRKILEEHLINT